MNKTFGARLAIHVILASFLCGFASGQPILNFSTQYATVRIDDKGSIVSLTSRESGKEYSPAGHASALMSLHEYGQPYSQLLSPVSASFNTQRKEIALKYPNGATAVVKLAGKETYFRFQLISLTPRGDVDNIVWGPLHTSISKIIGDMIGVVRDDDFAIGMLGLDDNTITGPVEDGDCYGMGYYIHSPDPVKYPVPPNYKEGQWFNIGGDGHSDTAFYSHPEAYFQMVFGSGAKLRPEFGSDVVYHARDRRNSYTHFYALLPGMKEFRPRHMVSDPVPGVDFIGSGIALYACPDDDGLKTIEKITLAEGLPHNMIDGKWIRDPAAFSPTVLWHGSMDGCIEYTQALGLKTISRDGDAFYANRGSQWEGRVGFKGKAVTYKEFGEEAHKHGLAHGGLHTLCLFLQGGISNDVTPVPSKHLLTVLRTKLANDLSPTDTHIVVTDPSFLAEKGTWPNGDGGNFLQIGEEILSYDGISDAAPWTLKGIKRGQGTKAQAHHAGDELVKLQQNCYHGFAPDMQLMLDYADYYAELMARNGMDAINFDGFESTLYQGHGYYGTRIFCRRLFETYAKLTGGKVPHVRASCVFAGAWEYLNACDFAHFDTNNGTWDIEGKDISTGFSNSYYPRTFGVQGFSSNQYELENLQAKSIGWDATYELDLSTAGLDACGDKDGLFTAFRAWQEARAAGVFTKQQKLKLRDPKARFHLEKMGDGTFKLSQVQESALWADADGKDREVKMMNDGDEQPLEFALKIAEPWSKPAPVANIAITLPDGSILKSDHTIKTGEYIICKGGKAYVADANRKKVADLKLEHPVTLPKGEVKFTLRCSGPPTLGEPKFMLTVSLLGKGEMLGKAAN